MLDDEPVKVEQSQPAITTQKADVEKKRQNKSQTKKEATKTEFAQITSEMLPQKKSEDLEPSLADDENLSSIDDDLQAPTATLVEEKSDNVLQNETNLKKMYIIDIAKIFIRKKPLNGKRVDVWSRGHRFVANGEQVVGGITWLKITEDCGNGECKKLDEPLWVSKRYSKEISEDIKK